MEDLSRQIEVLEKKASTGKSPLFAQLASYYLDSGRAQDALRLCEDGLANYPFYATGHLIRGKALVALKMNAEARREFTWVVDFMPGNATAHQLLDKVPHGEDETVLVPAPPTAVKSTGERTIGYHKPPAAPPTPVYTPPAPAAESSFELPKEEASPFDLPAEAPATSDFGLPPEAPATSDFGLPPEAPANDFGLSSEAPTASGFDLPAETPSSDFGMAAEPQPQPEFGGFGGLSETPPTIEPSPFETPAEPVSDPFGFGSSTPTETTADPFGATPAEPPAFTGFDAPSPEPSFAPEPTFAPEPMFTPEPAAAEPFTPAPDFSFGAPPSEEESFETYAARMRGELTGENTLSLDEFLNTKGPDPLEPEPNSPSIEELADKLQSAKKITPVINFSTKSTTTVSESDTPASTGFVTPTLAEIYAKQGWFDDAIKAYKTLANNKPAERDKFMARIAELEEQKKQSGG